MHKVESSLRIGVFLLLIFAMNVKAQNEESNSFRSCVANFTYVQGASNTVAFLNRSVGKYTSCQWSFGDGITSVEMSPVHTYNSSGYYLLSMIIKADAGFQDTLFHFIQIHNSSSSNSNEMALASNSTTQKRTYSLSCRSYAALIENIDHFFDDAILVTPSKEKRKGLFW